MKKALCLILTVLFILSCFVSCKEQPDTDHTQTTPAPETEGEDISSEIGPLSDYILVRDDDANEAVKLSVTALKTALRDKYSLTLDVDTDWLRPGQQSDPEKKELLVGLTNRPETAEVMKNLPYGAYAIRHVGNKIVIAAHTLENLDLAIEHFVSKSVVKNDTVTVKYEYTSESDPDFFTTANPLSEYKVVYSMTNASISASVKSFTDRLESLCGISLKTANIFSAPTEYEILIGCDGRDELVSQDLGEFGYSIRTEGKKLIIAGKDTVGLASALNAVSYIFLSGDCSNMFNLPADTNISGSALGATLPGSEHPARADGTNLRVMSYNILCELWNDQLAIDGRDALVGSIIHSYQPDVAGLQEVSAKWYSALKEVLGTRYKMTNGKIPNGEENFNVIIYDPEKVEMLEEGVFIYETGNSPRLRNLTWAHFRRLSDGATFIVTCTHWDSTKELRPAQAPENARLVLELQKKYNCPVITTGDMNEHENAELLPMYLEMTGFQNAKTSAEVANRKCKTTHAVGSAPKSGASIDNITASKDVTIKYYNVLVCKAALDASDHVPIYADLTFGKK